MELPTLETILPELDQWRKYHKGLGKLLEEAALAKKKENIVNRLEGLFKQHVLPQYPELAFDKNRVSFGSVSEDSHHYSYKDDRVNIVDNGCRGYRKGDWDYFCTVRIKIDGKIVYEYS